MALFQNFICMNSFHFQDTPKRTVCNYSEERTVHAEAVNLKRQDIPGSHVHFSALEPRELKVLKLLEQNQAHLPKLITPGSRSIIY